MEHFGNVSLETELIGTLIHHLENILTLRHDLYDQFDALYFWLEYIPGSDDRS